MNNNDDTTLEVVRDDQGSAAWKECGPGGCTISRQRLDEKARNAARAALEVLKAANGASSYGPGDILNDAPFIAAAALRATADRMTGLIPDVHPRGFAKGVEAAAVFIEAIAAKLESQP